MGFRFSVIWVAFAFISTSATADVNIYSYRQLDLIKPVLAAFTEETGIKTRALFLNKGMIERLKAEGRNSPADVILTTDISRLTAAKSADVTQAVTDAALDVLPTNRIDTEKHWFGLTARSRVVFASKERVEQDAITYEDLANPEWKGRICIRSGQHDYNIALIASMIAHHGEAKATEWLTGLKANLARKPNGNDRAQAKGVYSGECDIGIGNTYYFGLMQTNTKNPEQQDWAKSIKVLFPNANGRGSHVNISGMAMAKHAPNRDEALKLMQFLVSEKAQETYAKAVFENPLIEGAKVSDLVAGFGDFNPDALALEEIADLREKASELVDQVGFNQ